MRRVCLVGAGFIAQAHAEALATVRNVKICTVVDPNPDRANHIARRCGAERVFASIDAALAEGGFDCAHVLVPPDVHLAAALPLLSANKPVLLEKPLAASSAECAQLLDAAERTIVGINQNFVFHPAFVRFRELLRGNARGRPRNLQCIFNMPLRQFAARQFGHWMFDTPGNLLLEQAVHPLSQIVALGGEIEELRVLAGPPAEPVEGIRLFPTFDVALGCRNLPATMRFAVGQSFPCWTLTAVCDDGILLADMLSNSVHTTGRTRWLDAIDLFVRGHQAAAQHIRSSWRNMRDYCLSTVGISGRSDPFFRSMKASIAEFHRALDEGRSPELDGSFGAALVKACERIREQLPGESEPAKPMRSAGANKGAVDVAIIGGTGFIGTHLTKRLVDSGFRVSVMARGARNLPRTFQHERVVQHRGDIRSAADVETAIEGAGVVVNLAHGGGGGSWDEIRRAMVDGAATVARACLAKGSRRLIHVGSVASLYLGPQSGAVTGATPPDPRPELRADYARAKILCDRMLSDLCARERLPLVILRPAIVVGEGATPFHSALGFYNNEQHCIGWNDGRNPLPFVWVEDVAEAIILATKAQGIEGRAYNLAGDVRLSAREYIGELGMVLERPLRYHPKSPIGLWLQEIGKWSIKRLARRQASMPSRHDILSRGMIATLDCSDAKRDLGWRPIADRVAFVRRAILVHAQQSV